MADQLTTGWTDLMYELREAAVEAYPVGIPLLQRFKRAKSRKNFSGTLARVPIFTAPLQGTQFLAEGGNVTIPQVDDTAQAHIRLAHASHPISVSPELLAQSVDNAAARVMASKTKRAFESMARTNNEAFNGDGTGKIAGVNTAAAALTCNLDAAPGAPRRQLYKGRIVDILEEASGVPVAQGLKRKIDSVTLNPDGTVASVTFLTGGFGGGSGNITFTLTSAIYIQDSVTNGPQVFNASQGIQQIGAVSGTFEDIAKGANEWWQGTDGRNGVTSFADPDLSILDAGFLYLGERTDLSSVDFMIGDPGVVLLYQSMFYNQMRYAPEVKTLDTGLKGPTYNGMVMLEDFDHQRFALTGITEESLTVYGYTDGPDWDRATGSMFQRFGTGTTRTKNVEAWLIDDYQLGAHECRTMVRWQNLNRAS